MAFLLHQTIAASVKRTIAPAYNRAVFQQETGLGNLNLSQVVRIILSSGQLVIAKNLFDFTMFFTTLFAALFLFSVVLPGDAGRSSKLKLKSKMEESQVVPDMIDSAPANVLQVSYGPHVKVQMGNELTPTQVNKII